MGGSTIAHLVQPSVSFLQPPSHSLAYPVQSHFTSPQPPGPHMHPLLAHSRLRHAPIQYDVRQTPSVLNILDSTTHSPVPDHILSQPATDPPICDPGKLILKSHQFPWPIVVKVGPLPHVRPTDSRSIPSNVIKNLDVLYAIHTSLQARVNAWEELGAFGNESRARWNVQLAYEKRCSVTGGWEGGFRRVDWLGDETHLVGIEMDRNSGTGHGKLVFAQIVLERCYDISSLYSTRIHSR